MISFAKTSCRILDPSHRGLDLKPGQQAAPRKDSNTNIMRRSSL
jgi:hypothetical protein